jgi:hypothetical protein
MNRTLKIATVLTWINMIIWGLLCLNLLFSVVAGATANLIFLVLFSAIVLHSYASLQLQKSIRKPAVPLNSQTPTGIRFIGIVSLFLGLLMIIAGVIILTNAAGVYKFLQDFVKDAQAKTSSGDQGFTLTIARVRLLGIFYLLVGLSVAVNVNLNVRLLRWYYYIHSNSDNPEK